MATSNRPASNETAARRTKPSHCACARHTANNVIPLEFGINLHAPGVNAEATSWAPWGSGTGGQLSAVQGLEVGTKMGGVLRRCWTRLASPEKEESIPPKHPTTPARTSDTAAAASANGLPR